MITRPIFAFVLMPFDHDFDDVYNIGIKEAASQVGIVAERLDEQIFVEGMLDRIYRQIERADIVIADMSGKNPNVFYEVGYAHAKDKLCILVTVNANDIPFDLKHRRHIVYNGSIKYLRDELTKNLEWAKSEIEGIRNSQIRVDFRPPTSDLVEDAYGEVGTVEFEVDLYNDSNNPSATISAIYLYSSGEWKVLQNENECPSTASDKVDYGKRYFLSPPVTRLEPKSWAQLRFKTSRYFSHKWRGDLMKGSYDVSGRLCLKFITSTGSFDHNFVVSVRISGIPF